MAGNGFKWRDNPEALAQLKALLGEPMTHQQAAEHMGMTLSQVRGAIQYYGLDTSGQRRPTSVGREWSRAEYDQLEQLRNAGVTMQEIARRMNLTYDQVRGATERLGLQSPTGRSHRKRKDWHEIDPIIRDCIEAELMSVPQIVKALAARGYHISRTAVHNRVQHMGLALHRRLVKNAEMRRNTWRSIHGKRRTLKRQQRSAA